MLRFRAAFAIILCALAIGSSRGYLQAANQSAGGVASVAAPGDLIISEFRLSGPGGAQDEFIEVFNSRPSGHVVASSSGTGYGIAASDGITRCTIPNGTLIPGFGHFLCVNAAGYSLASYAAGDGTTATGDASYTADIPLNAGIAIFNNNTGGASYTAANRVDAVGSTSESNTIYREGAGYLPLSSDPAADYSLTRHPTGGCTSSGLGACTDLTEVQTRSFVTGIYNYVQDLNDNQMDFVYVDVEGANHGAGQRLGAPGPENLSSPWAISGTKNLLGASLDTCAPRPSAPNQIRDLTADPDHHAAFGTFEIRRTWTNKTGGTLTRLRFRLQDVTSLPRISGVADFRARTSDDTAVTVDRPPCGTGSSTVTVHGTTLEDPPSQVNGGANNASLSVGAISAAAPLASGDSVDIRFVFGVEQTGIGRFCLVPETLPAAANVDAFCFAGATDAAATHAPADFDSDGKADIDLFNRATGVATVYMNGNSHTLAASFSGGLATYSPVTGDFDGDGRVDQAFYLEPYGTWTVFSSGGGSGIYLKWGGPGSDPVPGDYDGDGATDIAVYSAATTNWSILTSTSSFTSSLTVSWGGAGYTAVPGQDFDGDRRTDLVVYNERLARWYVLESSSNYTTAFSVAWGGPGYTLVPGDYDGDGRADAAVYRRSTGDWYVLESASNFASTRAFTLGGLGSAPVPADYDGDGKTDPAIYQFAATKFTALKSSTAYAAPYALVRTIGNIDNDVPVTTAVLPAGSRELDEGDADGDFLSDLIAYNPTTGFWSTFSSSSQFNTKTNLAWGGTGYTAVTGDYDGDDKGDFGVYQPSTGFWYVRLSSKNFTAVLARSAGGSDYIPVAGDYDGDRKTDFVVYQTTTGLWFGLKSSTDYTTSLSVTSGGTGFTAVPGDYDGDGRQDIATYRASTGEWLILTSSSRYTAAITRTLGGPDRIPVPADYDGDGFTDLAVYRPSTAQWTIVKSSSGRTVAVTQGNASSTPVAGDWDGDRRADLGVYNPAAGTWSILLSNGNYTTSISKYWGTAGYVPVPIFP